LIGSETFLDLLTWREPWHLVRLARLVVVPRSGSGFDPEAPVSQKVLRELGLPGFVRPGARTERAAGAKVEGPAPAALLVDATSLPISGSDLRRRAREGRSLDYRMPESVVAYIREHRLYRAEA
jgi:nicotinate-nucleotide adenylyltransferase